MEGKAYCHGAATIVNGIATGKGAAYGINLTTKATVEITDDVGIFIVKILGDESENTLLAEFCVKNVLAKVGLSGKYGAKITTSSDIPISRGLKSSSSAANAIILATLKALDVTYSDMDVINLGIDASLRAKVTLTGAFDDACATYFGNVVVTDNLNRIILSQYTIDDDYEVIIHVPTKKIKKMDIDISKLKKIKHELDKAHVEAMNKNFEVGILINGLAYGHAMGLDTEITNSAMAAGAITAGISGTGPATVILAKSAKKDDIVNKLGSKDQIICTTINRNKAGSE